MRKWSLFISILLLLTRQSAEAQCNSAFNHNISGSGANFTAVVAAPQFYHFWTFGDGNIGSGSTTSHIYNLPGTYQVKHTIYDSLGTCRDSTTESITLNFTPVCQASFYTIYDSVTYSYGIYCYSNSNPSATQIRNYTWRVNNVVVGGNLSHLFFQPSPGNNTVCLTIESMAGCTDTYCQTFQVPASCNLNPTFTHTANPANRKQISFSPSTNGNTLRYLWNFGDGYSSVDRQPVHTYYTAGTYLVKLSVRDTISNCLDTIRQQITVQSGPEDSCTASFSYSLNNYGLAQFTAHSNQPISTQFWSIYRYAGGDSAFINTPDPSYQFIDTGAYLVCLTLTTNSGCTRTYCEYVYVGNVQGRFAERIPAFPNPVSNGPVRFSIYIGRQEEIKVTVTDLYGNQVLESRQTGFRGSNLISIPTERLGKGQYFVEICVGYRLNRSIFQKL
ncbi:MAG: PKD domain-containing protein [Chitinophagaceae bacterium]|nr:PKD domain-containing protein [Chitinophagaceae bacterium]